MIKCTGENCTKKDVCMRHGADAVVSPHFEGNQSEQDGCTFFMPTPESDPYDDMAVSNINPIKKEE